MATIRKVSRRGTITLGKAYAGRPVVIEELEPEVWTIRFVHDNELWLLDPEVKAKLDRALAWAEANPPRETNLRELAQKLLGDSLILDDI
jgi:hypothetical protein